jgi:hypothetical protein
VKRVRERTKPLHLLSEREREGERGGAEMKGKMVERERRYI